MNGLAVANKNGPLTHRTKLVNIQDSLLSPSDDIAYCKGEMTEREVS